MLVQRGYKYKLLPTQVEEQLLFQHCYNSNQACNICISLQRTEFKLNKPKKSLNYKLKLYSSEELSNKRTYLTNTDYDDIIKTLLKNRKLNINTKVLQQTRKIFLDNLKKKYPNIEKLKQEYYDKQKKKLNNFKKLGKSYKIKKFELFNFKKSGKSNSFQTTSEQFTLMDYINPITNKNK